MLIHKISPFSSIHIANSLKAAARPKLVKEYGCSNRTGRTNMKVETRHRNMHENLTDTKIHKLTESFAKTSAIRYFYGDLKSPAYGG